jgi:hypothetical protein
MVMDGSNQAFAEPPLSWYSGQVVVLFKIVINRAASYLDTGESGETYDAEAAGFSERSGPAGKRDD